MPSRYNNNNDCVLLQMTCRDFNVGEQGCKYGQSCKFKHACSKKIAPSKVSLKLRKTKLVIMLTVFVADLLGRPQEDGVHTEVVRGGLEVRGGDSGGEQRGIMSRHIFVCGGLG